MKFPFKSSSFISLSLSTSGWFRAQRAHPCDPHDPSQSIKPAVICPVRIVFDHLPESLKASRSLRYSRTCPQKSTGWGKRRDFPCTRSIKYHNNHFIYQLRKLFFSLFRTWAEQLSAAKPWLSQLDVVLCFLGTHREQWQEAQRMWCTNGLKNLKFLFIPRGDAVKLQTADGHKPKTSTWGASVNSGGQCSQSVL